ncbi:hypothetical protein Pcinc_014673 [Petrolisthes cinctipes]|uniref:Retrovirus-related Pol poly from transposon TNT 1-94 n=1 Tax=Petrolisthes cinctipes TaxID=88211 RepID=A0AAE1FUY1_PETCI|nr:hypothetical protein Pcinc_014673 [Petrolisthes cinctipes]
MALIKEDVWSLVNGTEPIPDPTDTNKYSNYVLKKNKALAIVVLSVDPKLLYLLGEPEDPKEVWNKLADQFQKKTWSNKLQLRRRLYALRLKEGGSVQEHIKTMTEIFNELSIIGDQMNEEDRVVHLLASLPESYDMLVNALEANSEIPKMEFVTEKILHEERKSLVKDNDSISVKQEKAFYGKESRKTIKCHHCGKEGHINRNCWALKNQQTKQGAGSSGEKSNSAESKQEGDDGNESVGLLAAHAMSAYDKNVLANTWIVDSGATCHMCNNKELFVQYNDKDSVSVSLGDGHSLEALGRYGHLGIDNLKILVRDDLVDGLNFDVNKELEFCEACVKGKSKKSPFPCNKVKPDREPLELIHSDVCGKINEKSLSNGEYFVTFIDDATRYVWVYILKGKHEVFAKFKEWKKCVENQMGRKIKILRTDNGGEYKSNDFEQYLIGEGIRHEYTIPKTPEQNGVSERMNRTLVEQIRAMLIDSGLPHRFWAEALSTACYLKNRSPARALKGKTPCQALMGKKPTVHHLRVLGCVCYAHVPKDERRKLDPKSVKCIFLGYGSEVKGYRLFDLEKKRILNSRDVTFDESHYEFKKEKDVVQTETPTIEIMHSEEWVSDDDDDDEQPDLPVRLSERVKRPPDMYGEWVSVGHKTSDPTSVSEALLSDDKEHWMDAMKQEMSSIQESDVYELVELPKGSKSLKCRWVFKKKILSNGSVERYKARLVAQGCSQKFGIDYDETFCPVARFESVRTVLALASQRGMKLHHMDVTTAFLNGTLMEEVYMKPDGFVEQGKETMVCKLKKSIYGLKQSLRCWNYTLDSSLRELGFVQTSGDPCIYDNLEDFFIVAVYVDDIILACNCDDKVRKVKDSLSSQFKLKDLGELQYFLGVKVVQDTVKGQIWIDQPLYIENILKMFGMEDSKPVETPADPNQKVCKATDECTIFDKEQYQSAVGSLLYLSVKTRPDIAYAVNSVTRYSTKPTSQHWKAVKRIMRYLKGTRDLGILYNYNGSTDFVGYSDADWAGDIKDRKSTSGYCFHLGGGPVSWSSKKQSCVALSTAEAEYMALASAIQEAVWLRKLAVDIQIDCKGPLLLYEDNQSTIAMSKNPQFHGKTKHIDIKFHYVLEKCNENVIQLVYCPTNDMIADIFTKGLNKDKFKRLREMLGMCLQ